MKNWSRREFSRRDLERHGEPLGECVTMPKLGGGYICGGGGKGSSPPPPDYRGAAEEQATSSKEVTNMQTWANRPSQNTPWGSVTWDTKAVTDPATGQAVTAWTQNYNLTPEARQALNAQLDVQNQRSQLANSFMDRVENEYSRPFNWDAMPQRGGNVATSNLQYMNNTPRLQTSVGTESAQRMGSAPQLQTGMQTRGVQNEVNFGDNGALQGATGADRERIENALFDRMAPQHQRQQSALEARLANQGITAGSEAYKRATQSLGDQQSRERYDALQTAGQEQARMAQLALANRQQLTNEDMQQAGLYNAANNQAFNQDLQAGQFGNQAMQNQFGMGLQGTQANNAAIQQDYAQRLGAGQFGNTALQNQQNMYQNAFGFNNQAQQQAFDQSMRQSQYQNQLRQAAIAEEMQRRGMSLNEMNALLTGQQVGMQQMPQFNAAQAAQPTQYLNAANMQYQANLDASNLQNANQNSTMNGLFQLGSTAAMGAMMFSDSRLKKIVRKVGEKNGIGWYLFKYLGSNALYEGAIAQEVQKVKPEAVKQHANGFLMVDYAALEA